MTEATEPPRLPKTQRRTPAPAPGEQGSGRRADASGRADDPPAPRREESK